MADNEYHFITRWRVAGTAEEVAEILGDAPSLVRWWPSVYLDVNQLAPGDARAVGKVVDLYTEGWLPYSVRWQFQVTEVHEDGFSLVASGDFVGRGIWTYVQDGPDVLIQHDRMILAAKPLLRNFSLSLKPT